MPCFFSFFSAEKGFSFYRSLDFAAYFFLFAVQQNSVCCAAESSLLHGRFENAPNKIVFAPFVGYFFFLVSKRGGKAFKKGRK